MFIREKPEAPDTDHHVMNTLLEIAPTNPDPGFMGIPGIPEHSVFQKGIREEGSSALSDGRDRLKRYETAIHRRDSISKGT
jgi:hypothetical protein